VNPNTLASIKKRALDEAKFSNDVVIDTMAAKNFTDKDKIFNKDSLSFTGYVRNISVHPFGYILLSSIQVKLLFLTIRS
jgi:hypothetical protein